MKPKITLSKYYPDLGDKWICSDQLVMGLGRTPQEAYDRWASNAHRWSPNTYPKPTN